MVKELTKAEEQIMHILWDIRHGFIKDILKRMHIQKPAYTTVSTIVRIMEKKGFVGYRIFGKTHEYYPLIEKEDYIRVLLHNFIKNYYGGSIKHFCSSLMAEGKIGAKDLERILLQVKHELIYRDKK